MEKAILIQLLGEYSELDDTLNTHLQTLVNVANNSHEFPIDNKDIAILQTVNAIRNELIDFNKLVSFLTDVIDH